MLEADEARRITALDSTLVERTINGICAQIEQAAAKGERSVEAWFYDRFERRYSGDLPEAVMKEVDRRFEEAGYELSWSSAPMVGGVTSRVYRW